MTVKNNYKLDNNKLHLFKVFICLHFLGVFRTVTSLHVWNVVAKPQLRDFQHVVYVSYTVDKLTDCM